MALRILLTACGTALMLALMVLLPQATRADKVTPSDVPDINRQHT